MPRHCVYRLDYYAAVGIFYREDAKRYIPRFKRGKNIFHSYQILNFVVFKLRFVGVRARRLLTERSRCSGNANNFKLFRKEVLPAPRAAPF